MRLLLRPCEVLSGIADATILKVAHNSLGILLNHDPVGLLVEYRKDEKYESGYEEIDSFSVQPVDKMRLARRIFTLEFKADVVRHRKAWNLSWADAGTMFDVRPKLVKE